MFLKKKITMKSLLFLLLFVCFKGQLNKEGSIYMF